MAELLSRHLFKDLTVVEIRDLCCEILVNLILSDLSFLEHLDALKKFRSKRPACALCDKHMMISARALFNVTAIHRN